MSQDDDPPIEAFQIERTIMMISASFRPGELGDLAGKLYNLVLDEISADAFQATTLLALCLVRLERKSVQVGAMPSARVARMARKSMFAALERLTAEGDAASKAGAS